MEKKLNAKEFRNEDEGKRPSAWFTLIERCWHKILLKHTVSYCEQNTSVNIEVLHCDWCRINKKKRSGATRVRTEDLLCVRQL
jgi:hypothetical protein